MDLDEHPSDSRSWGGSPRMGRLGSPGLLSAFARHSPKSSGAHARSGFCRIPTAHCIPDTTNVLKGKAQ